MTVASSAASFRARGAARGAMVESDAEERRRDPFPKRVLVSLRQRLSYGRCDFGEGQPHVCVAATFVAQAILVHFKSNDGRRLQPPGPRRRDQNNKNTCCISRGASSRAKGCLTTSRTEDARDRASGRRDQGMLHLLLENLDQESGWTEPGDAIGCLIQLLFDSLLYSFSRSFDSVFSRRRRAR